MPRIAHFVHVEAPLDAVFAFVADFRNLPRIQSEFKTVRHLAGPTEGLGAQIEAQGAFHGLPLTARMTIVGFQPPQALVSDTTGGIDSRSTWSFRAEQPPGAAQPLVRVTLVIEYEVRLPGLGLLGGLVHRDVDRMTSDALRRLKSLMEGQSEGGAPA
jgi:uncharacterized membrane protein